MADPTQAKPGMIAINRSGSAHVLAYRKEDNSGWWLEGTGGLADQVLASDDWQLLTPETVRDLLWNQEAGE